MNSSNTKIVAAATTALTAAVAIAIVSNSTTTASPATPSSPTTPPLSKPVSASSVSYAQKISPEHCDEHGRMYGGELCKMLDVAAGVVAAKHSGGPCVTISVDRVIFLQEIKVSDIIHLSVAVNRAWGSSMEIGVRVMRESSESRELTYCCHAYITFVARRRAPTPPTPSLPFPLSLFSKSPTSTPTLTKFLVPSITPTTTLEQKRHLLAGRRRAHRIKGKEANERLLQGFRDEILRLEKVVLARRSSSSSSTSGGEGVNDDDEFKDKEREILSLQTDLIVDAYMRHDPDIRVVGGDTVVAEIEGFMDPISLPLETVEKMVRKRGMGGYRRLSVPLDSEGSDGAKGSSRGRGEEGAEGTGVMRSLKGVEDNSLVGLEETLVMCLWTVRPQHANSKQILFGGTLMRWIEETSAISARRVSLPHSSTPISWSSAAIDSLTFLSAVLPGEVVYVRACVVKVWSSSVEVFTVAFAEDRNSPNPIPRLISQSFFTLVAVDPSSGRPLKGALREVKVPLEGPVREVVEGAERRREERLVDKRVLLRVYA
ncbi:Thioesterase/thiol ester dehydrase-isomerase [Meredithblackwellia eburnea MCA 4105]